MAEYPINKGIGRPVEFKGLKAQYLFIFCGGLLALFVLFVGEHGLMKLGAARSHPRYLINRRRITRLLKRQRKEETT